jgi:hypothetical protein
MEYQDESFVELTSSFVGSKHTDPSERAKYDSSMQYHESRNYNDHGTSSYDRYYRPRLQIFNKTGENAEYPYVAGGFTFLLPLATSRYDWEETGLSQTFNGRNVRRTTNFELLQHWYKMCCTKHIIEPKSFSSARNLPEKPDCRSKALPSIPHFRLVDVETRSVVEVDPNQKPEYAALSYVWGNAKRLLLRSDNLDELSTPDVLSDTNEDVPKTFIDALEIAESLGIRYLWIDALCILQDNADQLLLHMNSMDSIYSSATLTIVSDTESADTGIPGISVPRSPLQATFQHSGKVFLSSKRTFGTALQDSNWESRAWCLQEKVFSKRLLIFTPSQTFFHCTCATWFEDTILENKERDAGNVHIAERSDPSRKPHIDVTFYTAYEAHRSLFGGRNFWSLVEIYSKRQLSFESDSIRAFSGILKSIENEFGSALWGVPQYTFARGLTWDLSNCKMSLRRPEFPSWSWAGWRANDGSSLHFTDVLLPRRMSGMWELDFYYYRLNERTGGYDLTSVDKSNDPDMWGIRPKERARWNQSIPPRPTVVRAPPPPAMDNPFARPPKDTSAGTCNIEESLPKIDPSWDRKEVTPLPSPLSFHTPYNPFAPKDLTKPTQAGVDDVQTTSAPKVGSPASGTENAANEHQKIERATRPILSKTRDSPSNTGYDTDEIEDFGPSNNDGSKEIPSEDTMYLVHAQRSNDILEVLRPVRKTIPKLASSIAIRTGSPTIVGEMENSVDEEISNDAVETTEAQQKRATGPKDPAHSIIPSRDTPAKHFFETSVDGIRVKDAGKAKGTTNEDNGRKHSVSSEGLHESPIRKTAVRVFDGSLLSSSVSSTSSASQKSQHHISTSLDPTLQYKPLMPGASSPLPSGSKAPLPPPNPPYWSSPAWDGYRNWGLPDHPGGPDPAKRELPPLQHDPTTMPPLSHILRFFTSIATLYIDPEPDAGYYTSWGWPESYLTKPHNIHAIRLPKYVHEDNKNEEKYPWSHIELPPDWDGKGKEAEFAYISRGFDTPSDMPSVGYEPELLNVILIERVNKKSGGDVIYKKVTSCGRIDSLKWRSAKPVWKLINLA